MATLSSDRGDSLLIGIERVMPPSAANGFTWGAESVELAIWNSEAGRIEKSRALPGQMRSLKTSADGALAVVTQIQPDRTATIHLLDTATLEDTTTAAQLISHVESSGSLSWIAAEFLDNNRLLVALSSTDSEASQLREYDIRTGQLIDSEEFPLGVSNTVLEIRAQGGLQVISLLAGNRAVIARDALTGNRTLLSDSNVFGLSWSAARVAVAGSYGSRYVVVYDTTTLLKQWDWHFGSHGSQVESLAWSPDGRQLVAGTGSDRIYLWEAPAE